MLNVSKATIDRRIRRERRQTANAGVISFAEKLVRLAADAPDGYCRDEIFRLANTLRNKHALHGNSKKVMILDLLKSNGDLALDADEIAEEINLGKKEVARLLDELTDSGKVLRVTHLRSGVRGRTKSFLFKLNLLTPKK